MPADTYLARERARRCEWCAKGWKRVDGGHDLWSELEDISVRCTAPSDAALYEELAKEREELQEYKELLDYFDSHPNAVGYATGYCGAKSTWTWHDSDHAAHDAVSLIAAIRAAREKEKA